MGEAKRRGTFEQRRAYAIAAGRDKNRKNAGPVFRPGNLQNGLAGLPLPAVAAITQEYNIFLARLIAKRQAAQKQKREA